MPIPWPSWSWSAGEHLTQHDPTTDGRLFRGFYGGDASEALTAGPGKTRVATFTSAQVDVLLCIRTHCLDGGEDKARARTQRT